MGWDVTRRKGTVVLTTDGLRQLYASYDERDGVMDSLAADWSYHAYKEAWLSLLSRLPGIEYFMEDILSIPLPDRVWVQQKCFSSWAIP